MKIEKLVLSGVEVNTYIVYEEDGGKAYCIDPGEAGPVLAVLEEHELELTHILMTHGHFDHINGVGELKEKTGALICIHEKEADWLTDARKNLSALFRMDVTEPAADVLLHEGDYIEGCVKLHIWHTPGHSPGSVCYLADDCVFCGDLLFKLSVGRSDFPGSDGDVLMESIKRVVTKLPHVTKIYPGHGEESDLAFELKYNPFLKPFRNN